MTRLKWLQKATSICYTPLLGSWFSLIHVYGFNYHQCYSTFKFVFLPQALLYPDLDFQLYLIITPRGLNSHSQRGWSESCDPSILSPASPLSILSAAILDPPLTAECRLLSGLVHFTPRISTLPALPHLQCHTLRSVPDCHPLPPRPLQPSPHSHSYICPSSSAVHMAASCTFLFPRFWKL